MATCVRVDIMRRGSMPFKNDDMFMEHHNLSEPLRSGPDYGESGNINFDLEKLQDEDAKKIDSIANKIVSSVVSTSRTAGLYSRLKQDLRKHGPRLMLNLMGDACEKISDELRMNGQLEESKVWDKNIDLLYSTAKKVRYS